MYSGEFAYHAPTSLQETLALLQGGHDGSGDIKVLAGGQSLLPLLKLRLAETATLIDVAHVPELRGIQEEGDGVVLGAMTTYFQAIDSPIVQKRLPLLVKALHVVGDPQVRARGTIGGSVAHADPAGDLPAVALALDAEMRLASASGQRRVKAADFFLDLLTTAMQPAEVLTAVRFTAYDQPMTGSAYAKHRHPASGYAVVGVAAVLRLAADGTCEFAHIGITGSGSHAVRAHGVEQALTGKTLDEASIVAACARAADGIELMDDSYASADYRAHLTQVLAKRALRDAAAAAQGHV